MEKFMVSLSSFGGWFHPQSLSLGAGLDWFGDTAPSGGRTLVCARLGQRQTPSRVGSLLPSQEPGQLGGGAVRSVYPLLPLTPAENKAAWLWEVARQLGTAGGGREKGWQQAHGRRRLSQQSSDQ